MLCTIQGNCQTILQELNMDLVKLVTVFTVFVLMVDVFGGLASPLTNQSICPPNGLTIAALELPPYVLKSPLSAEPVGILGEFFSITLKTCFIKPCSTKAREYNVTYLIFNSTEEFMSQIVNKKTDMAFPINRPLEVKLFGESHAAPLLGSEQIISSPTYSLLVDVKIHNIGAKKLAFQTLFQNIWPILVFTILLTGISGVSVWILETYYNQQEFPRSFLLGTYEGFWWAFVSMTTVGYGDKTPRSVLGRLFGVIWILTGLVVIAVFTASATGALNISLADISGIQGKRIGVLANTPARLEAQQNGAEVTLSASFGELYQALKRRDIDGILMDSYRAAYYLNKQNDQDLKVFENVAEDIEYKFVVPISMFSRLLVDNSCFKKRVEKPQVDNLLMRYLKPVQAYHPGTDSESLFSGNSDTTRTALLVTTAIFLGLLFLGAAGEFIYKRISRKTKSQDSVTLKEIRVHPDAMTSNLEDVQDKVCQLICEVGKLQEQVSAIATQPNRTLGQEQKTNPIQT